MCNEKVNMSETFELPKVLCKFDVIWSLWEYFFCPGIDCILEFFNQLLKCLFDLQIIDS